MHRTRPQLLVHGSDNLGHDGLETEEDFSSLVKLQCWQCSRPGCINTNNHNISYNKLSGCHGLAF